MNPLKDSDCVNQLNIFQLFVILLALFTVSCLCTRSIVAQKPPQPDPFDAEVLPEFSNAKKALDNDDYDQTLKLLSELRSQALKTKNKSLLQEVLATTKKVNQLKRKFAKVSEDFEALSKGTNDPEVYEQIGNFYCAEKENWGKGLLLLSKSDNPELRSTVLADLERPTGSSQQAKLSDAWWKLAAEEKGKVKKAYQMRGRYWYLLARPSMTQKERTVHEKRLHQIALRTDKIVLWNVNNGRFADRGAVDCIVTLLYKGKPVWRQVVQMPWSPEYLASLVLRPPNVRFDQIHVDITRFRGRGGGLSEIQVYDGNINVAKNCSAIAKEYWEQNRHYHPNNVTDGIINSTSGYWLLNSIKKGWILVDMVTFRQQN